MTHTPTAQPVLSEPALALQTVPLNTSRYTTFYLTMLILSTIGTSIGLISGIFGLFSIGEDFSISLIFGILNSINYVILSTSIWALVLLWLKKPLGIQLKLGTYAASILLTVGLALSSDSVIKLAIEEASKDSQGIDASSLEIFMTSLFYVGFTMSIVFFIIFGILWWKAWKIQVKADQNI
ncbi:hypothetical protein H7X68_02185 [Candidatus Saccharibacteria bacterium]|nr:hypothetical protein [Candidatus Saccharibacteria bacterium]